MGHVKYMMEWKLDWGCEIEEKIFFRLGETWICLMLMGKKINSWQERWEEIIDEGDKSLRIQRGIQNKGKQIA